MLADTIYKPQLNKVLLKKGHGYHLFIKQPMAIVQHPFLFSLLVIEFVALLQELEKNKFIYNYLIISLLFVVILKMGFRYNQ